jgi:hypothetical protein
MTSVHLDVYIRWILDGDHGGGICILLASGMVRERQGGRFRGNSSKRVPILHAEISWSGVYMMGEKDSSRIIVSRGSMIYMTPGSR